MNSERTPSAGAEQERKPYQKPAILWEEELEVRKTLAVACAKTAGRGGICNAAPAS